MNKVSCTKTFDVEQTSGPLRLLYESKQYKATRKEKKKRSEDKTKVNFALFVFLWEGWGGFVKRVRKQVNGVAMTALRST